MVLYNLSYYNIDDYTLKCVVKQKPKEGENIKKKVFDPKH